MMELKVNLDFQLELGYYGEIFKSNLIKQNLLCCGFLKTYSFISLFEVRLKRPEQSYSRWGYKKSLRTAEADGLGLRIN